MTNVTGEEGNLLQRLTASGGVASPAALAASLGIDRESVRAALDDLRGRGFVERRSAGYRLTRRGTVHVVGPAVAPFEAYSDRYDSWFEDNRSAYESELAAIRELLPPAGPGVEIGVGTGRFAGPLGVEYGVDPSPAMLGEARDRGVQSLQGVAEALPLRGDTMELALLVTTICFVDDLDRTLREARRVLRPGATLLVGFVARDSPLRRVYREKREENPFYRDATFERVPDLVEALSEAGFRDTRTVQTLFASPDELAGPDRVESGWGEGSFVVVAADAPAENRDHG